MNYEKKFYYKAPRFRTMQECLYSACKTYAERAAFTQVRDKNNLESVTFRQFKDNVVALGSRLIGLGLKDAHIAIVGENSIQWITAYMASVCGTGVAVPIDKELDVKTLALQINFSDSAAVFFSGKLAGKIDEIVPLCPQVKYWVMMRPEFSKQSDPEWLDFDTLIEEGYAVSAEERARFTEAQVDPEDLCDLIFTSGTTGANKGVMLSHKNICTVITASLTHIDVTDVVESFSCLPINHSYEKNCHVLCAIALGKTVNINDDMMHLVQNVRRFDKAGISIMVPMILETIQHKIQAETKKSGLEQHMQYGIRFSNILRKFGIDRREKFFKPILEKFSPELREIVVGGSALKEETRQFFDSIGFRIVNGYGISECGPLVAANFSRFQRPGSVGRVVPGCEVKIANPRKDGNGNIYVRGDNVMMGYYKDPESTQRVMVGDGWFDTGDLGHLDKNGFLYLSGREKNLIILSNGKNVFPEEVEDMMCECIPYVKEAVVYTDDEGLGIYASVYLDPEYIQAKGITDPYGYLMKDIQAFNRVIPPYKRINDVSISDKEFPKTTTMKIQRFKVVKTAVKA